MSYYTKKKEKAKSSFSAKSLIIPFSAISVIVLMFTAIYYIASSFSRVNPELLQKQFSQEYNTLIETHKLMQAKGFNIPEYGKNHAFAKKFAGFFKLDALCDDYNDACLWNNLTYRTLDGDIIPVYYGVPNVGQFITRSGALYMLYTYQNDLWIFVDTNGIMQKPNRFGLDLFAFYIGSDNNNLRIMGSANTPYQSINLYCNPYTSNKFNGLSCPYKAVIDKEYFSDTIKILY